MMPGVTSIFVVAFRYLISAFVPQSRPVARNAVTKQSYALYAKLWDHHSLSGFVMTYGHFLNN
jgi:hypothetical protein